MSMSKMTPAEVSLLKELLHRAKSEVGFQQYSEELRRVTHAADLQESLSEDQEFQCITPTSMTDASKRRLSEDETSGCSLQPPPQLPVKPFQVTEIDLPTGITSVEMWGCTVIDFGKLKDRQLSYLELMQSSKSDAQLKNYVDWIRSHTTSASSAQLKDLHKYVKMFDHRSSELTVTFPGSHVTRKMKNYS